MTSQLRTARPTSIVSKDGIDGLTGIRNRRGFAASAGVMIDVCRRTDLPVVLLKVELVGFDDVVRANGHRGAEALLRAAAGLLNSASRPGDLIGRTGVAEFSMLLSGGSLVMGEQIRARLIDQAEQLRRSGRSDALRRLELRVSSSYLDLDAPAV